MTTLAPLIQKPENKIVSVWYKYPSYSNKNIKGFTIWLDEINNPNKIPTQNPEHCIQVSNFPKVGYITCK
jgi:hypothetical protein